LLAWADARARRARGTPFQRPQWFVNVFAEQAGRRRDLDRAGFACQADAGEDSWSKVLMRRSGPPPSDLPALPPGFVVRPLGGQAEVEACVELQREVFGSKNMTVDWRSRMVHHPAYRPDLDLVVAAPDGRLAAFCICWLLETAGRAATGQVEPLGAREEYRGLGLGRAVLWEGLHRLHLLGAESVLVETDRFRGPALALYELAGFRVIREVLVYRKDYE
jgi:ribosomal protein S18 acetylase RimI-like enzyme